MMSLSSFSLKGSGWYATDYAGKKTSSPARTEKKESASADSTASSTESATTAASKED
jgi:predicted nucleic acid-binding Zn ribbon protein